MTISVQGPGRFIRVLALGALATVVCGQLAVANGGSDTDRQWLNALRGHDIATTQRLTDDVGDVDLAPSDGRTALMLAAKRGMVDLVAQLIKRGADVNASNSNGGTPLMYAAIAGNTTIGQMLIERKANTRARGSNGWSPLMVAAAKGHAPFVELLVASEADVNAVDVYGWTPLARAAFEKRNAVVDVIASVKGVALDTRDDQGATALHHAASVGAREIIQRLIAAGADRSIKDYKELTAADRALAAGFEELAELLGDN